ncbi:MAG: 4Fe-4S binding protein, partial [Clostridia bacterium]|nr:4Fe-4S binding protein [Clostridia bacterium]
MKKIWTWIKKHLPSKRKLIQLYAALLFNANLKGFGNGKIYTGPLKNICTPGLNCYSCPGASGACPLGALQNSLAASGTRTPYYVFGIIILYGFLFGRWICGFLCPFGWIQELLHKIPTPKLKKNRVTRVLSYFKYVILIFFVGIVPIAYAFRSFPLPGFCKYICPAGTLEGAMGLLANKANEGYLRMLGPLFTWKFLLMVSILVASVFIFRFFCRFLCPLGALYGLFNKISLVGVKVDKAGCTDCGICVNHCQMDVLHVGDQECINCGECIGVCPTKAISWKGSQFLLAPNAIDVPVDVDAAAKAEILAHHEARKKKIAKRNKILKIAVGVLMVAVLAAALIYYNFIDGRETEPPAITPPTTDTEEPNAPTVGTAVGNLCPEITLDVLNKENDFTLSANRGKVTVLNFWYTTCT